MNKLINAFKSAWGGLKKGLVAADNYLQSNAPKIESEVEAAATIAEKLAPAAAPAIAAGTALEETAMSELMAAVHSGNAVVNATDGTAVVTLSAGLYSSVQALVATLSNHPDVVAASKAS